MILSKVQGMSYLEVGHGRDIRDGMVGIYRDLIIHHATPDNIISSHMKNSLISSTVGFVLRLKLT